MFKKILTAFGCVLIFCITAIWTIAMILGSVEICWWILTGEFFHFISLEPAVAQTF